MDILSIFTSASMSLFALVLVIIFLIIEIRILRKERMKSALPQVPRFNQAATPLNLEQHQIKIDESAKKKLQYHKILLVALIIMTLFFAGTSVLSFINSNNTSSSEQPPQVIMQEIQSRGIKIYDSEWNEIIGESTDTLEPDEVIYIGVETINSIPINQARIKINEEEWNDTHITTQFNDQYKLFYREYKVSTEQARLQIEAQLHSPGEGWLSE